MKNSKALPKKILALYLAQSYNQLLYQWQSSTEQKNCRIELRAETDLFESAAYQLTGQMQSTLAVIPIRHEGFVTCAQ